MSESSQHRYGSGNDHTNGMWGSEGTGMGCGGDYTGTTNGNGEGVGFGTTEPYPTFGTPPCHGFGRGNLSNLNDNGSGNSCGFGKPGRTI